MTSLITTAKTRCVGLSSAFPLINLHASLQNEPGIELQYQKGIQNLPQRGRMIYLDELQSVPGAMVSGLLGMMPCRDTC